MGITMNESRWVLTTYVSYNISYGKTVTISGKKYKVPTSASYKNTTKTHGDLAKSSSIGSGDTNYQYNSSNYNLKVWSKSFSVSYTYYTRGSCSCGNYQYGGSANGSGTSGGSGKYNTHNKVLK